MHDYDWRNNKINKSPKRHPKPPQKTPNYHPSMHPPKCQNNTHPQCQSLSNCPASAFHPHNDWSEPGQLLVHFQLAREPTAGGFMMWSCLPSQAISSSATTLCSSSANRRRARLRMSSRYLCCLIMLLCSCLTTCWKSDFVVMTLLGFGRHVSVSSSDPSPISLIISLAAGWRMTSRGWLLRPPPLHIWVPNVLSAGWPQYTRQSSVGLSNFITAFTHLAAVLLSKIGVTFQACGPQSPLGSCWEPWSTRMFQLGSARPTMAAFTIDKMVVLTNDVTIASDDSSFSGPRLEKSWV